MRQYVVERKLGSGTFGSVFLVRCKQDNHLFALKQVRINEEDIHEGVIHDSRESAINRYLMDQAKGPEKSFFVNMNHQFYTRRNSKVMEYVGSSLSSYIPQLSPPEKVCVIQSLIQELHYLHTHHVIHRDLKPSNILVDAQTKQIKLCDFGCSKRITGNVEAHKSTPLVTSRFYRYALLLRVTSRAPELLMGATHYSFAIDIWSLGCGMDTSFPHHIQSSPKCSLDIPSLYR
ncbi:hypothetical protein WA588_001386 [Blastocystis sp. NMH]